MIPDDHDVVLVVGPADPEQIGNLLARIPNDGYTIQSESQNLVRVSFKSGLPPVEAALDVFESSFDHFRLIRKGDRVSQPRGGTPTEIPDVFPAVISGNGVTQRWTDVARISYEMGYWDWPRTNTQEDVAEFMDLSQPTVNKHKRHFLRLVVGEIFDPI